MMPRPYQTLEMAQLEVIFASNFSNASVLAELEAELDQRSTKKAADLQAKVLDAIKALETPQMSLLPPKSPVATIKRPVSQLPHSEPSPHIVPAPVAVPSKQVRSSMTPAAAPALAPPVSRALPQAAAEHSPVSDTTMPLHEAEKILGVRNHAPWAQVEAARYKLVSQASPERLAQLPLQQRDDVTGDARRANSAYLALAQHRCLTL